MAAAQFLWDNRDSILQTAARHGARNVRVCGSFARGDARPDSDVDLLVEPGPERSPWFPSALIADLEELLGRRVDVLTEGALHEAIRDRILREAKPL
jgi:predicted nucleotidyltransferase